MKTKKLLQAKPQIPSRRATGVSKTLAEALDVNITGPTDSVSSAVETIDYAHHEIHSGSNFRVQANGDNISSLIIAFQVPAGTKLPHMVFEWSTESSGIIQLIEGPTWTPETGTDRAPQNSRRDSIKTSILQGNASGSWASNKVTIDPTGLTGGEIISDKRDYHTATQQSGGGGGGERRAEIILAAGLTYALVWTTTDGSNGAQLRAEWYEHTDH